MPSDKFIQYKKYLNDHAALPTKEPPATFEEWLRFEENEEPMQSGRNLELATALASGDGTTMPDVRSAGPQVMHEFGMHAGAYLTALARSRIPRMTRMIAYCDQIEDQLMEKIPRMTPVETMRAYGLLGQTIAANMELIKYMLDFSRGTPIDPTQQFDIVQFGDKVADSSFNELLADKHDRDRLRNAVRLLITNATPHLLTAPEAPAKAPEETKAHGKKKRR